MLRTTIVLVAALASVLSAPQAPAPAKAPQPTKEPIAIVKLNSDISPDGSFTYEYETANQIKAEARGTLKNAGNPETEALSVTGSFSFVGDDGVTYSITYVADENGYQPQGAHLPTPPPIPEAILKSIAFNEKNPEPNQPSS